MAKQFGYHLFMLVATMWENSHVAAEIMDAATSATPARELSTEVVRAGEVQKRKLSSVNFNGAVIMYEAQRQGKWKLTILPAMGAALGGGASTEHAAIHVRQITVDFDSSESPEKLCMEIKKGQADDGVPFTLITVCRDLLAQQDDVQTSITFWPRVPGKCKQIDVNVGETKFECLYEVDYDSNVAGQEVECVPIKRVTELTGAGVTEILSDEVICHNGKTTKRHGTYVENTEVAVSTYHDPATDTHWEIRPDASGDETHVWVNYGYNDADSRQSTSYSRNGERYHLKYRTTPGTNVVGSSYSMTFAPWNYSLAVDFTTQGNVSVQDNGSEVGSVDLDPNSSMVGALLQTEADVDIANGWSYNTGVAVPLDTSSLPNTWLPGYTRRMLRGDSETDEVQLRKAQEKVKDIETKIRSLLSFN